jgi:hypothetical protein
MGDRGNVFITSTTSDEWKATEQIQLGIYVYLHWGGYDMPERVRSAIRHARERWHDDQYLTRILIDQITREERDQMIGAGVGLSMGDNEYPITIVDVGARTVAWASEGQERNPSSWKHMTGFAAFVSDDWTVEGYPPGIR